MIDWDYEKSFEGSLIGVDEVGRGPWSGPVVAGAVWIDPIKINLISKKLNDSKKLSLSLREEVFSTLYDAAIFSVGASTSKEIDKFGIIKATWLAMEKAICKTLFKIPVKIETILVDGNLKPNFRNLSFLKIKTIKFGDSISPSIAAASVVAKIHRDKEMVELNLEHPGYDWDKNKGYGTKNHKKGLVKLGPTQEHRMTFKPMKFFI